MLQMLDYTQELLQLTNLKSSDTLSQQLRTLEDRQPVTNLKILIYRHFLSKKNSMR